MTASLHVLSLCPTHQDAAQTKEVPAAPENYDIKFMGQTIASVRRSQVRLAWLDPCCVRACVQARIMCFGQLMPLSGRAAPSACGC